jgi:hypothetical protein
VQSTGEHSVHERAFAQRMPLMGTTITVHAHALFVTHDQQSLPVHDDAAHFSDPQLGLCQCNFSQAGAP